MTEDEEEVVLARPQMTKYPQGWDEERVRRVLDHYENRTDEEAVAEGEAAYGATTHTLICARIRPRQSSDQQMPLLETILASVKPDTALDVGCGCGQFTTSLGTHCARIVAVDPDLSLLPRWRGSRDGSAVQFCCMDGRALAFGDNTFSLVFERDALHHTRDWPRVIDEMLRVSSRHVLIEEPIDDLRSAEKRNTFMAQGLLIELQQEVGFPHYRHLSSAALLSFVQARATVADTRIDRSDARISFSEFFRSFDHFVAQSARETYWRDRLEAFRASLAIAELCDDDRFLLLATKDRAGA